MDGIPRSLQREMDGREGEGETVQISQASGVTQFGNSTEYVDEDENARLGHQTVESLSTEWTEEKHSLYINSMEASFVEQLHNHEYCLWDLHSWLSRKYKLLDPSSSQPNPSHHFSSGKVPQRGHQEKLNYERSLMQLEIGSASSLFLENPLTQDYKSASKAKEREVTIMSIQEHAERVGGAVHIGEWKYRMLGHGRITSSKQLPHFSAMYSQDSVGSNTEATDQNFAEEECSEGETQSSSRKKKRRRTAPADTLSKDQAVPLGKSPLTMSANSSQRKKDEHSTDRQQLLG